MSFRGLSATDSAPVNDEMPVHKDLQKRGMTQLKFELSINSPRKTIGIDSPRKVASYAQETNSPTPTNKFSNSIEKMALQQSDPSDRHILNLEERS